MPGTLLASIRKPGMVWWRMSAWSGKSEIMWRWLKKGLHVSTFTSRKKRKLNQFHEAAYVNCQLKPESKKLPKDAEKAREITQWMCNNFYDIRAFGAVMTTEVNCGQVRGPVQLAFAKSVLESIMPQEISITRMAVTNEKDLEKERTMGRKHIVRIQISWEIPWQSLKGKDILSKITEGRVLWERGFKDWSTGLAGRCSR